jgi:hypothetical protein
MLALILSLSLTGPAVQAPRAEWIRSEENPRRYIFVRHYAYV